MSFYDALSTALDVLFDTDGQSITYAGSSIDAINIVYSKDDNRRDKAEMEIRKSDVSAPDYRDAVVIDGAAWTVKHWTSGNRLTWNVSLEKGVRPGFER